MGISRLYSLYIYLVHQVFVNNMAEYYIIQFGYIGPICSPIVSLSNCIAIPINIQRVCYNVCNQ